MKSTATQQNGNVQPRQSERRARKLGHAPPLQRGTGGKASTPPKLEQTTFCTSRLLNFCSEKELVAQTGHDRDEWPLVALKELLDNALDACEEAGVAPDVEVTVDADGIAVADNGPGLAAGTIEGVLDFSARVSSREAYVAPTRGAQGNALKTILTMPFVLDGDRGRVDITANGQRHEITFAVDRIEQRPVVTREMVPDGLVRNGTTVKLWWPDSACSELRDAEARFLQLAADYTVLNPHLTLNVTWFGQRTNLEATDAAWRKLVPSEPTSPHWYGPGAVAWVAGFSGHLRSRKPRILPNLTVFGELASELPQVSPAGGPETAQFPCYQRDCTLWA